MTNMRIFMRYFSELRPQKLRILLIHERCSTLSKLVSSTTIFRKVRHSPYGRTLSAHGGRYFRFYSVHSKAEKFVRSLNIMNLSLQQCNIHPNIGSTIVARFIFD